MSGRGTVRTERAPEPVGPYSQGVWAGDLFFSAGQVGLEPGSGRLVGGGIAAETRRALDNLEAVLEAAGLGLGDVVKTTVFLADLAEFEAMNGVYADSFPEPHPARSTVQVARLPRDARVEIEVVAHRA